MQEGIRRAALVAAIDEILQSDARRLNMEAINRGQDDVGSGTVKDRGR